MKKDIQIKEEKVVFTDARGDESPELGACRMHAND